MPKKYEDYKKSELLDKAKDRGKTNYTRLNKEDLIKLLRSTKKSLSKSPKRNYYKNGYAPSYNIDNIIKNNKIVIFGKDACGYCKKSKELLDNKETKYEYIDITYLDKESVSELKSVTKAKGIPIIFINQKFLKDGYNSLEDYFKD